jgi:hypothetical protein
MAAFPQRPASHVTGDRAIQLFLSACDPEWVVSPLPKDYGLDLRVEVARGQRVTGEEFFVQVKGRAGIDPNREYPPKARVKQATINYWLGKLHPTLIALVDTDDGVLFFDWLEHAYADYPQAKERNGWVRLPLRKNSEAHDFHAEVGRYIARYYSAIRKDAQDLAQSWHLTQVLFHVSALFRACARMAIEYQRRDFEDPEEVRHVVGGFYTVFAAHDELLSALREGRLGVKTPHRSRLLEIVTAKLGRYDEVRGKFFQRQNRVPTDGYWLIPIRYTELIDYLLPTLNVLQDIEEVLFQALALGKLIWPLREDEGVTEER